MRLEQIPDRAGYVVRRQGFSRVFDTAGNLAGDAFLKGRFASFRVFWCAGFKEVKTRYAWDFLVKSLL